MVESDRFKTFEAMHEAKPLSLKISSLRVTHVSYFQVNLLVYLISLPSQLQNRTKQLQNRALGKSN